MNEFEKIKSFVINYLGKNWININKLNPSTRIYEDLRIDGDDATEFFVKFQEKFDVDFSNFDLGHYFNDEGFDPIGLRFLFLRGQQPKTKKKSITLGDLETALKNGRWIENDK